MSASHRNSGNDITKAGKESTQTYTEILRVGVNGVEFDLQLKNNNPLGVERNQIKAKHVLTSSPKKSQHLSLPKAARYRSL